MSRTFKLEDPMHPNGGITINVKHDNDCVFCDKCTDIYWDYTNLIYGIVCSEDHDVRVRPCPHFVENKGGKEVEGEET